MEEMLSYFPIEIVSKIMQYTYQVQDKILLGDIVNFTESKEIYGINSLDKTLPNSIVICGSSCNVSSFSHSHDNYTYKLYGKIFKKGSCCEKINSFGDECPHIYVTLISETQLSYCKHHYKNVIKSLKISEKKKMMDAKLAVKKQREDKLNEKKKLLEEKNLKQVKKQINAKVENIIKIAQN